MGRRAAIVTDGMSPEGWELRARLSADDAIEWWDAMRLRGYRDQPPFAVLGRARRPVDVGLAQRWSLGEATAAGDRFVQRVLEGSEGSFVALERIEGVSLATALGAFVGDVAAALALGRACCEGLRARRAQKDEATLTRDLAPTTLWVVEDGVRLANVAAARAIDLRELPASRLPWLTPEEVRGELHDAEAEVYAVAVTILGALNGRSPYARPSAHATLEAIARGELAAAALDRAPSNVRLVLMRALDRNPRKRPPTTDELAAELAQAAASDGVPVAERAMSRAVRDRARSLCIPTG